MAAAAFEISLSSGEALLSLKVQREAVRHSVPSAGQPWTLRLRYQDFRISSDIVRQSLVDGTASGPGQCYISLAFWKLLPMLQSMKKSKPLIYTLPGLIQSTYPASLPGTCVACLPVCARHWANSLYLWVFQFNSPGKFGMPFSPCPAYPSLLL